MHRTEFAKLLKPLLAERMLLLTSIAAGFVAAALNVSRPLLLGDAVSSLVSHSPASLLIHWVALFSLSWVLSWFTGIAINYVTSTVSQRILVAERTRILQHLFAMPLDEGLAVSTGRMAAHTNSDLPLWTTLYGSTLAEITHAMAQLLAAFVVIAHLNGGLSWLVVPFLVFGAVIPAVASKRMVAANRIVQDSIQTLLEAVGSLTAGLRDIVAYSAGRRSLAGYSDACKGTAHVQIRLSVKTNALNVASTSMEVIAYVLVLAVGGLDVLNHRMGIGSLVSFLATIEMLFYPSQYSNVLFGSVQSSVAAARRVWEFLDTPEGAARPEIPKVLRFNNVTYAYPGNGKPALQAVTLSVTPGELLAIVGESGSGKSTLLHIMAGLFQPTEGTLEGSGGSHHRMAFVAQEPTLLAGTIEHNVVLGGAASPERVSEVLAQVNAGALLQRLPEGLATKVGSGSGDLSVGERKRICIARALVTDPDILLMDEPTAGLDWKNGERVWDVLERLGPRVTRVVATHELTRAMRADAVAVLAGGRLVAYGRPSDVGVTMGWTRPMEGK